MLPACGWGKKSTSGCKKRYLQKVVQPVLPTVSIFACQKNDVQHRRLHGRSPGCCYNCSHGLLALLATRLDPCWGWCLQERSVVLVLPSCALFAVLTKH